MADRTTRIGMPVDRFIEQSSDQPFEIINREKRLKLPTPYGHKAIIRLLFMLLDNHTQAKQFGEVYSKTPFILTDDDDSNWVIGARIPDVMYYPADWLSAYEAATPNHNARPLAIVPAFVIEVASSNGTELDEKIDAYIRDGVRLIWVLDPPNRSATVYTPDLKQPTHIKPDEVLEAGDVLPGFKIALAKLFD